MHNRFGKKKKQKGAGESPKKTLHPIDKTSQSKSKSFEMPSQQLIKKQIETLEERLTKKISNSTNRQIY